MFEYRYTEKQLTVLFVALNNMIDTLGVLISSMNTIYRFAFSYQRHTHHVLLNIDSETPLPVLIFAIKHIKQISGCLRSILKNHAPLCYLLSNAMTNNNMFLNIDNEQSWSVLLFAIKHIKQQFVFECRQWNTRTRPALMRQVVISFLMCDNEVDQPW